MESFDPDNQAWATTAIDTLLGWRSADGGWPYRPGQASATEPTALGILALDHAGVEWDASTATDWLIARRRSDDLFTASENHAEASWTSPLAALALHDRGYTDVALAAAEALLALEVHTPAPLQAGLYGFDTQIPGWPWTDGDFSFVEPTGLTLILLKRLGYRDHPRVRDGASLLRDRAIDGGGWNYGEPNVLGGDMFPIVVPTALALLALADEQDDVTAAGLSWLRGETESLSSLLSLTWATLAIRLLDDSFDANSMALTNAWAEAPSNRRGPMETALALLALADRGDHPLGVA